VRSLFQERGETEAEFVRSTAGAVVLIGALRQISAEVEALRKVVTKAFGG